MSGQARTRVFGSVRNALAQRERLAHPGSAPPGQREPDGSAEPVDRFARIFRAAGGEVVRHRDAGSVDPWLRSLVSAHQSASQSPLLPSALRVPLVDAEPERADLGVSLALGAAAECGSLLLTAREGRRLQLLPRTHLIWVRTETIQERLEWVLEMGRAESTAALALHSGPSKSADIGQILVTGVHGPGRVIAAILD